MFGRFSPISSLSLSLSLPYIFFFSLSYACAWRRLSPSTDGQTGEAKDLWLFYFTDQPDLSTKLTAGLEGKVPQVVSCHTRTHYCTPLTSIQLPSCLFVVTAEAERGNWKEEMTKESTTMLYRALHNLIERSLSLSLLSFFSFLYLSLLRSLLSENFLPLGKWFARPDSSVATDGRSAHTPPPSPFLFLRLYLPLLQFRS